MAEKRRSTDIDVEIGKKLKLIRTLKGWSQNALASELDITFQQLQKYEKGVNRVSASRLYEITLILNVTFDDFFSFTKKEKQPPLIPDCKVLSEIMVAWPDIKDMQYKKSIGYLVRKEAKG